MRQPEYLSPTSVKTFFENTDDFYLKYLAENRIPRDPQTQAMSIGSAFDAYAKSALHEILFGKGADPRFEFEAIFDSQVEPHNRDWAKLHGFYAFKVYKDSGAYADMLIELQRASTHPKFEIEIRGYVNNVPILGKPDVLYVNKDGYAVVLDWKVNGWCSKSAVSPMKGYINLREKVGDWVTGKRHKDAEVSMYQGCLINTKHYLEDLNEDWAIQLAMYTWIIGEPVGTQCVIGIDQLACNNSHGTQFPAVRIAEHRLRIREAYQKMLFARVEHVWDRITTKHIFTDLSREESDARCEMLEETAKNYDPDFARMCK